MLFPGFCFSAREIFIALTLSPWRGSCWHWTNSLHASNLPVLNHQVSFIPVSSVLEASHLKSTCCFLYPYCHCFSEKKINHIPWSSRLAWHIFCHQELLSSLSHFSGSFWCQLWPSFITLPTPGEQPCRADNFQNMIVVHSKFILT